MDLSQLPKMSETPKPPQQPAEVPRLPDAKPPLDYGRVPISGAMGGVSVWISLIVGVIFLFLGADFGRWLMSGGNLATNVNWMAGPKAGLPVTYFELQGGTAWADAGFFVMGVALILDAVLLLLVYSGRGPARVLAIAAICVTAVALALNLGVVAYLFSMQITPIATLVAVLVGGMMLFDQFAVLADTRRRFA